MSKKSTRGLLIIMAISLSIAFFWDKVPIVRQAVHRLLDPLAGGLLDWNVNVGMILFSALIAFFIIIIQKYTTDQETLREIKKEQKRLNEEAKKHKHDQEKFMKLQSESAKKAFEMFPLTMRPLMYTSIPIILFFRWFGDYFLANPVKIFGFLGWFWAYLIFSIIFTTIFRKVFKVA